MSASSIRLALVRNSKLGRETTTMKNEDIRLNKQLLAVASSNLTRAGFALKKVAWPPEMVGIGDSIDSVRLALQQTINCLVKVLEDL
jgi:hypothetical protein